MQVTAHTFTDKCDFIFNDWKCNVGCDFSHSSFQLELMYFFCLIHNAYIYLFTRDNPILGNALILWAASTIIHIIPIHNFLLCLVWIAKVGLLLLVLLFYDADSNTTTFCLWRSMVLANSLSLSLSLSKHFLLSILFIVISLWLFKFWILIVIIMYKNSNKIGLAFHSG